MLCSLTSLLTHMNAGEMDTAAIRCLINSISRFIHLVSCQALKPMPTQKDFKNMIGSLKLMKQVLDEVVECKIYSHGFLIEECEELDLAVNEAREFMESWCSKMSKIFSVLRSEPLLIRIQSSSLTVCHRLSSLSAPSTSTTTGVTDYVVCCMQELQCLKLDRLSEQIEEALRSQRAGQVPSPQHLKEIVYSLSLNSNQEILKESMAVEKERMKAQTKLTEGELDQVNQVVKLVSNMRDFLIKLDPFRAINGIPIPPDFRCPLSLELMLDPVIVASGQTYDRPYIQKWLDNGLNICPKTRQLLVHTHVIPNYTVKALIKHWCEGNKIRFFEVCNDISATPSDRASPQNLIHTDSFGRSLPSSDSTSLSSLEVGNGFEQLRLDVSSGSSEERSNACPNKETEKFDHPSPEQSYVHSRSESASSAGSSIEYLLPASNEISRMSNDPENSSELSREITSEYHASLPSCKVPGSSPWLAGKQFHSSEARTDGTSNGNLNYPRTLSLPLSDSGTDNLTSISHVEKLVEHLKSQSNEVQTTAAAELRLLAKHNKENRNIIGRSGAIPPLVSLLYSEVKLTQEHVVTALLNLSINENNKAMIAEAGAIEPLIYVLKSGNPRANENAAATLFSLSVVEEYKAKIGRSGAVKALADLLSSGTLRGQKDAATALFNLSIFHENKAHIVKSGAVKYLVELMDPASEMADKALALLTNLSTIAEGRSAIVREGGIPLLVEAVETGSQRGKENAVSTLWQLSLESSKFCTLVLQEGAVPPLVALSQSGTPRAKEKAQQLLSHFRSQREGASKKGKP